jgi:hypothetical protein
MNEQEFYLIVGYFANPARMVNIEVEMPQTRQAKFIIEYATMTNSFPLPTNTNAAPYYVWAPGANKYGLEIRAYFVSNQNIPPILTTSLEPRGFQNRPGYDAWNRRISRKRNLFPLLKAGFVLGDRQNINRIRKLVPQQFINHFNNGFAL